ncbi:MAG: isoaspartyl peptidase/L-asparaginase family protein [Saprospiraceae bacterium]
MNKSILGSLGASLGVFSSCTAKSTERSIGKNKEVKPQVIATWNNPKAAAAAWNIIQSGGTALDAVEQGARVPEGDVMDRSVGYGGRPDREGKVTLDACIMDSEGNAGSVCYLQEIKHPVSVARKVMEETPHVILAGKGAQQFAVEKGFKRENLLTPESEKAWKEWLTQSKYKPIINIENHDTIGILALDKQGNLSGACTTSGLAYKLSGRVGDSPIIGAGLFVDNEVGAATATGLGEAVLKSLGSFLVVELMRQGRSPQEACEEAVMRIVKKQKYKNFQVGYIALSKSGEYGAYAIQPGFNITHTIKNTELVKDVNSYL